MTHVRTILLLCGLAASLASCTPPPEEGPPPVEPDVDDNGPAPATIIDDAASAICAALTRCCDEDSVTGWFAPWVALESLDDLDDALPPATPLDPATCPSLVGELLLRRPFGAWLAAEAAGEVTFSREGAVACLDALDATCGPELANALADPRCFAMGPPTGGSEQRRVFTRTRDTGPCTALDDGVGGVLYGSCDPERAFCCVDTGNGCGFPGVGDQGTCTPVAEDGDACGFTPLALCATGASCGLDDTCVRDGTAPLPVGAPCVDGSFVSLGVCVDSWCDVLESQTCEPSLPLGAACSDAAACGDAVCRDGACVDDTFCRGAP